MAKNPREDILKFENQPLNRRCCCKRIWLHCHKNSSQAYHLAVKINILASPKRSGILSTNFSINCEFIFSVRINKSIIFFFFVMILV